MYVNMEEKICRYSRLTYFQKYYSFKYAHEHF